MPLTKAYKACCDRCGKSRLVDTPSLRDAEQEVLALGWKFNADDTLLCSNCVEQENRTKQLVRAMKGEDNASKRL